MKRSLTSVQRLPKIAKGRFSKEERESGEIPSVARASSSTMETEETPLAEETHELPVVFPIEDAVIEVLPHQRFCKFCRAVSATTTEVCCVCFCIQDHITPVRFEEILEQSSYLMNINYEIKTVYKSLRCKSRVGQQRAFARKQYKKAVAAGWDGIVDKYSKCKELLESIDKDGLGRSETWSERKMGWKSDRTKRISLS